MIVDDADRDGAMKVAEVMGRQFVGATNLSVVPIDKDHLFKPVIHGGALFPVFHYAGPGSLDPPQAERAKTRAAQALAIMPNTKSGTPKPLYQSAFSTGAFRNFAIISNWPRSSSTMKAP